MIEWVKNNAQDVLAIIGAAYVLASLIVRLTPTPRDDEALRKVSVVLRTIATVFGLDLKVGTEKKAEPKEAPKP